MVDILTDPVTLIVALTTVTLMAGLVIIGRALLLVDRNRVIRDRLAALVGGIATSTSKSRDDDIGARAPLVTSGLGAVLARLEGRSLYEVRDNIARAGFFSPHALHRFLVWRMIGVLAGIGAGYAIGTQLDTLHRLIPITAPFIGGALAYLIANKILASLAEKRAGEIRRELPIVLEVLALTIESGLSLDQSLRWLSKLEGLQAPRIQQVLRMLTRELDQGQSYEIVLDRFADRLSIDEASDIAALFNQAIIAGTDLRRPLKDFAKEFSDRRFQHAREQIGKKSAGLSIVTVGFFLPVLLLLLGSPAIVSLMRALER